MNDLRETNISPKEKKKKYRAARLLGSLLMLAALVMSGIIFFNAFQADNPRARAILEASSSDNAAQPSPAHAANLSDNGNKIPVAKYSFYEQLQKRSNEVQAERNQHRSTQQPSQPSAQPTKGKNYRVQVGAFREKVQAEKMRQRMVLRQLPTRIIQSGHLHLVQVGPYPTHEKAEEIKAQLDADNIDTVIKTFVNQ